MRGLSFLRSGVFRSWTQTRRRFGYRRIHDLFRPQFPNSNHKRVYQLYCVANLAVKKRKKATPAVKRAWLTADQTTRQWCGPWILSATATCDIAVITLPFNIGAFSSDAALTKNSGQRRWQLARPLCDMTQDPVRLHA